MRPETVKLLDKLKDNYNLDKDKLSKFITSNEEYDSINIGDNHYNVYKGHTDTEINDLASYINSTLSDEDKTQISESIAINKDCIYAYVPKYRTEIENSDDLSYESKLYVIANYKPLCKVEDIIDLSDDLDDDIFAEVTFNIDENENLDLPSYAKDSTYIVFGEDLEPVDGYNYDKTEIKESTEISNQESDTNQALLIALNSEKEAITIYEMLLNVVTDEEQKKLLEKIYKDEKEHISLLSGLQASMMAEYVSEDNKEQLDSYASDIIESPSLAE